MIAQVTPSQFPAWVAHQKLNAQAQSNHPKYEVIVVDVRESWELQRASITPKEFLLRHIPMKDIPNQLEQLISEGLDRPIACLCHHGSRSQRVAEYLVQNGFTHVCNITGGIAQWAATVDNAIPQY